MVEAVVRMQCRERKRVFEVDTRVARMSPLFTDMLDEANEASECISLDFADEATFERVLDYCKQAGYPDSKERYERRLIKRPELRELD
mmetsp:Transcript_19806/g.24474  ORF Transcript_19806/g.24474 Transcript_19806/m.24474 type:complete len:88 (-) Transcript_19806:350-613(-)|eukprot:CAMPEP_0170454792 /NCGR_PEP_ID=MMETSP0123-20130129/2922_1 /TAXON_ID=182087 /ORGANISM="Favella ehrenbergii, Strain Fehren 1" /LENGTH=87 /DNA_ID=CAMNT_0010717615 /DNA_START=28 /DNA_END=291 /DNA_ORIENTATION=+